MGSMHAAVYGGRVWRQRWPHCALVTTHRTVFTRSVRCHALERVEVAHINSYRPSSAAGSRLHAAAGAEGVTFGTSGYAGQGAVGMDIGGTPLSLSSGIQLARSLPRNSAALEAVFFRDSGAGYGSGGDMTGQPYGRATRYHCLLCQEDIDPPDTPRSHLACANRAVPLNHATREVCLDTLALLAMRGYPIDAMYEVWSDALYHHPAFSRIRGLVSPRWSVKRRAEALLALLVTLKDANVLDLCLAPLIPELAGRDAATNAYLQRRRVAFERLEYIGDNSWGANMAERIIVLHPNEQWAYSERLFAFNLYRDMCEMNVTLEYFFDLLQLQRLLPPAIAGRITSGKVKADVVEALLGELHVTLFGLEPAIYDDVAYVEVNGTHEGWLCALAQHCLTEMYDLIALSMLRELSVNAVLLAKEIAARHVWLQPRPALTRNKQRRGYFDKTAMVVTGVSAQTRTGEVGSRATIAATKDDNDSGGSKSVVMSPIPLIRHVPRLPVLPGLCATAQQYPRHVPHPLLALSAKELLPCTVCDTTGEDVFRVLHTSFERLQLLSDDALRIFDRLAHPPSLEKLLEQLVPTVGHRLYAQTSTDPVTSAEVNIDEVSYADPYYTLQVTPSSCPPREEAPAQATSQPDMDIHSTATALLPSLELARTLAYPPLQQSPSRDSSSGEGAQRVAGWPTCLYAPSRLVPPNIKPPSAGVVTEHNLHRGRFAFLGYDERKCALSSSAPALRRLQIVDTGEAKEQDEAAVDAATLNNDEAAVRRAIRATRLKWLHENPFFPHQPAMGSAANAPQTSTVASP